MGKRHQCRRYSAIHENKNKNILRYNNSFNAAIPAFRDLEYKYTDGKLAVKLYSPSIGDFYPITSFAWKQVGKEFELQGIELFSFLASIEVKFTYRKV